MLLAGKSEDIVANMESEKNNFKIVAIIQARMGSTRLPGKVLLPIGEKPMLEVQLERVLRCETIDEVVVAATRNPKDKPIQELCESLKIQCFRLDEEDVLKRFFEVAQETEADVVVRLTADCPIIDPQIIDDVVSYYLDYYPNYDYVSNVYPRTFPHGMDVEVFSFDMLEKAQQNATSKYDREHVTPYISKNVEDSRRGVVSRAEDSLSYRLTVDTREDLEVVRAIYDALYMENPFFTLDDILDFLDDNPLVSAINAHVKQKHPEQE